MEQQSFPPGRRKLIKFVSLSETKEKQKAKQKRAPNIYIKIHIDLYTPLYNDTERGTVGLAAGTLGHGGSFPEPGCLEQEGAQRFLAWIAAHARLHRPRREKRPCFLGQERQRGERSGSRDHRADLAGPGAFLRTSGYARKRRRGAFIADLCFHSGASLPEHPGPGLPSQMYTG